MIASTPLFLSVTQNKKMKIPNNCKIQEYLTFYEDLVTDSIGKAKRFYPVEGFEYDNNFTNMQNLRISLKLEIRIRRR